MPELATSPHLPASAPAAAPSSRERRLIWACMLAITALAWAFLFYFDRAMPAGADHAAMMPETGMDTHRASTASGVFFTFLMWFVMMVGMMAGSAAPVLSLFAAANRQRSQRRLPLAVLSFGLGYLVVWAGFSACAALAQSFLQDAALLSTAMRTSNRHASGAILCAAGLYQLTPWKQACLIRCRSPLGFLLTRWRAGSTGALRMGMRHGAYCLGCCWALMCVLFVVGVMNLAWVAVLALFVLYEKTGPSGVIVGRLAGAAMLAAGILFFAGIL